MPERLRPSDPVRSTPVAGGSVDPGRTGWGNRVSTAQPPPAPAARGPRRARLALKRIDPWSVLKFTFVYSLAVMVIVVVAVLALYAVLSAMGVFSSLDSFLHQVNGPGSSTTFLSLRRVAGYAILVAAINVVLFSALATLGAFIYNTCADLVGGIELTLSERD
jgi:hypothetical protein